MLVGWNSSTTGSVSFLHVGSIILATACYGLSLNTIKSKLSGFKSWEITALAFSFLAIPSVISLFITETNTTLRMNPHALEGLGYITILSVIGTCLALVIFNGIIALKSAIFASSVTYVIPIVAVLLGVFFNHESFYWIQLMGMLVILSGVVLANRK